MAQNMEMSPGDTRTEAGIHPGSEGGNKSSWALGRLHGGEPAHPAARRMDALLPPSFSSPSVLSSPGNT